MALDLSQVAAQVDSMAATLKAEEGNWRGCVTRALEVLHLHSADPEPLRRKIERSRTTWLVAGVPVQLVASHGAPPCPPEFAVVASDGSHIDVDRHSPVRCYLINTGTAVLRYGPASDAILHSRPTLYASDKDLVIADPQGSGEQPVEGALLGFKRMIAECEAIADSLDVLPQGLPAVALLDGSLIMWGLAGHAYPEYIRTELLQNGMLATLDRIERLSERTGAALASYISLPRSTEVVNALRIAICPHDAPDCDRDCPRSSTSSQRECDAVAGVRDRDLFCSLLQPGQRSATFVSRSSVVEKHYGHHEVRFCYVRVGEEIARVEFPRWVEERGLVDFVHAAIVDQCNRGQAYPVALSEAHEKAVVTAADRKLFQNLVETALAERRLATTTSEKSRSKRTRWV